MTQAWLYMRTGHATEPQCAVFKSINRQLIQVGNDFGTTEVGAVSDGGASRPYNRVIHWENDLYAINKDTIFKYDVLAGGSGGTGDWEIFYTFLQYSSIAEDYDTMGLIPCSIDGSGVLCTAYATTTFEAAGLRVVKIDKDLNVSEGAVFDMSYGTTESFNRTTTGNFTNPCSYRNLLMWDMSNGSPGETEGTAQVHVYDLKADTIVRYAVGRRRGSCQFAVLRDTVYRIGIDAVSDDTSLYKFTGGGWSDVGLISTTNNAVEIDGSNSLIAINDKLYTLVWSGVTTTRHWEFYELTIDSNGDLDSVTDIASLLPTAVSGFVATDARQNSTFLVDHITDGPDNPIYFLDLAFGGGTSANNQYIWNNAPTGLITFIANSMDRKGYGQPISAHGTYGSNILSGSGTLNVSQPCLSLNLNGLDIDAQVTVYGSSTTGVALEIYFDKEGEHPNSRGTISSTTLGSIVGNRVVGLTADNTTKFTVAWAAVTDGIVPGDNPTVAARVFVP